LGCAMDPIHLIKALPQGADRASHSSVWTSVDWMVHPCFPAVECGDARAEPVGCSGSSNPGDEVSGMSYKRLR
jgi:hypothetical protein